MGEKSHNTNLAAEYYALSMLYRVGANAHLTLGNKKSIDIVVEKGNRILTIDVKGLKNSSCFPVDNWNKIEKNHYLVFITFHNQIGNPESNPLVYVIPSREMYKEYKKLDGKSIVYVNPKGNRKVVELGRLKKIGNKYKNKWNYFI